MKVNKALMGASTHNEIEDEINDLFRGKNRLLAIELIKLAEKFIPYWPMTLRAFYYQAVSAMLVSNNISQYRLVGKIYAKLRREGLLDWDCMIDKTRSTSDKRGRTNVNEIIQQHFEAFLHPDSYQRCLIQDQNVYVEISVEKDALSTLVQEAAWKHCTRVNVTRGQISATMLNEMAERFENAVFKGKNPILLHFGDLDPSGVQIPISIKSGLLDHHGIDVDVKQIALTPDQCRLYNLPKSLDAAKAGDPNVERWFKKYGSQSPTELDALHPENLQQLVIDSLDNIYDLAEMAVERETEFREKQKLSKMRKTAIIHMRKDFPEEMKGIKF